MKKAIDADPNFSIDYFQVDTNYCAAGDLDSAENYWSEAVELERGSVIALVGLSIVSCQNR